MNKFKIGDLFKEKFKFKNEHEKLFKLTKIHEDGDYFILEDEHYSSWIGSESFILKNLELIEEENND